LIFSTPNATLANLSGLQNSAGISDEEWEDLLQYTAQVCCNACPFKLILTQHLNKIQVLSNLVNYRTFGFTKIIPRISIDKFEAVVANSANAPKALLLWKDASQSNQMCFRVALTLDQLKEHVYASSPEESLFIGKRNQGHISNYYLGEVISDEEVAAIQEAAEKLGIDVLNTRWVIARAVVYHLCDLRLLFTSVIKKGATDYTLLIASAQSRPAAMHNIDHQSMKVNLTVEYGDFSAPLRAVVDALQEVRHQPLFRN